MVIFTDDKIKGDRHTHVLLLSKVNSHNFTKKPSDNIDPYSVLLFHSTYHLMMLIC